jgi:hypothetical protein
MIHSRAFLQALVDAGVISTEDRVRRVIIDAAVQEPVVVYVERYGDKRLLEIAPALTGVEIRNVAAPTDCPFVDPTIAGTNPTNPTDARCALRYGHDGNHQPYREWVQTYRREVGK